ncbi:unnamed protein product [Durusdinium trenchii]|uniref:Uncharacterized protein n=1 Tax=Durusdinium trenchii TaxID=1381693 RepID=A0ABP0QPM3_9DINO
MSNSNLFLPGCSVAYGLKLSLLWAKVHSLQDCKLAWDCLGFHVSAKKQQQLVSKLSIQELTPATPAIQCTWCRRKSLPNDSEADHEQSLEDESTERLHQELSGVTPDGTPGCHCLEFDSWWNEGKQRRFVYIRYSITEGAFQMAIDEDSNLYHVPVAYGARTGEAVTAWDLHVGAEVDILGRMTTLQRCSQTTAEWNKYWVSSSIGFFASRRVSSCSPKGQRCHDMSKVVETKSGSE